MASSNIKGMTIDIGGDTSNFQKALKGLNSAINSSQSALKNIDKALKLDPTNINLLAEKQGFFISQIDKTKTKIKEIQDRIKELNQIQKQNGELTDEQKEEYVKLVNELEGNKIALSQLKEEYRSFGSVGEQVTKVIGNGIKNVGSSISELGKKFAGISASTGALIVSGIKYNAQLEKYQTNLSTLLGSSDKASELLKDLKSLASTTPFETSDLISATQTMLGYGINVDKAREYLQYLGDVSMGDKEKLSGLSLAFAQTMGEAKLTGENLRQMINQGFNPLQFISQKTGKSLAQLKDEMSKGKISAEDVAEAFKYATQEGQPFFNAMENGSKTLEGQISTLKDNFNTLIGSLTEAFLPTIKAVVDKMNELTVKFSQLNPQTKKIISNTLLLVTALSPVLIIVGKVVSAIGTLVIAFGKIFTLVQNVKTGMVAVATAMNLPLVPIALVVGAVVGLIAIFVTLYNKCEWFRDGVNGIVTNVIDFVTNMVENINIFFTQTIPQIIDKLVNEILPNLPYYIGYMVGWIITKVALLPSEMASIFNKVITKVVEWFVSWLNTVRQRLPEIKDAIINGFKELPSKVTEIGRNIVEGLWNGISNATNWIKEKVGTFAKGILDGMKQALEIHSPSRKTAELRKIFGFRFWRWI